MIYLIIGLAVALVAFRAVQSSHRRQRRRDSLRRDKDGYYVWLEPDGTERRSRAHPDDPGGDWHKDEGGFFDGGGDGGDGGGNGD